jgi:hypothetical protein
MEPSRRNLQARPKILKRTVGTSNQPIRIKNFPKNVCLVPLNFKGAKNSYGGYPTEFAGSTKQKSNFSKKKVFLVPLKCIGTKNSYGAHPTEFAGSTQSEQEFFQKKAF